MKTYIADTNIFLRFLLKDIPAQYLKATELFEDARAKKLRLILVPEVLFELTYVLEKYYKNPREEVARLLRSLVKTPYISLEKKNLFLDVLGRYEKTLIRVSQ